MFIDLYGENWYNDVYFNTTYTIGTGKISYAENSITEDN